MKFSIVIPAHNEQEVILKTLKELELALEGKFLYEIIVVADHCSDNTKGIVSECLKGNDKIRLVNNESKSGFGRAVRTGLDHFTGDAVAIYMADASDNPQDLIRYFEEVQNGAECVFGSRFIKEGMVVDYPFHKLVLNRLVNFVIRILFRHGYNDTTNAFKCYRREVIEGCKPFISRHFNLTVELPLKAFIRGYKFKIIPISWTNRAAGISKLKIKEMGSRYFFMIAYCLLEKWLTGNDYKR